MSKLGDFVGATGAPFYEDAGDVANCIREQLTDLVEAIDRGDEESVGEAIGEIESWVVALKEEFNKAREVIANPFATSLRASAAALKRPSRRKAKRQVAAAERLVHVVQSDAERDRTYCGLDRWNGEGAVVAAGGKITCATCREAPHAQLFTYEDLSRRKRGARR